MKALLIGALTSFFFNLNAPTMSQPTFTVNQLFVATDQQDWAGVKQAFHASVTLDYSSMTGNPAAAMTPDAIVDAWKGILPGFEHTHHQIGNVSVSEAGNKAHVFCYGTATHYLPHEQGNVWTVVGSYNFELIREGGRWKITHMTFHFKYQDGNTALPQQAIENAKS